MLPESFYWPGKCHLDQPLFKVINKKALQMDWMFCWLHLTNFTLAVSFCVPENRKLENIRKQLVYRYIEGIKTVLGMKWVKHISHIVLVFLFLIWAGKCRVGFIANFEEVQGSIQHKNEVPPMLKGVNWTYKRCSTDLSGAFWTF